MAIHQQAILTAWPIAGEEAFGTGIIFDKMPISLKHNAYRSANVCIIVDDVGDLPLVVCDNGMVRIGHLHRFRQKLRYGRG